MNPDRHLPLFPAALTLTGFVFTASAALALDFTWDGSDPVTAGAQGGTGTWDSANATWWNGSANVAWPVSGTDHDAIFGEASGAVTLDSVTANDLLFSANGYVLSGAATLTLNGTTPTITTGTGISASIGNLTDTVLAGSAGLVKAGLGTLTLNGSAVNPLTGGVTIKGGTLALNLNNLVVPTDLIDPGNSLLIGPGTLAVTGKSSGDTSQSFAVTQVASGTSAISFNRNGGTTGTLNLGTITHATGGIVGFTTNTALSNITVSTTEMIKVSNGASATNGGLAAWAFAGAPTTNGGRWVQVAPSGTLKTVLANTVLGTNWSSVTDPSSIYTTSAAVTPGANVTAQGLQNAATANSTIAVALGANTLTVNGLLSINSGVNWNFTSGGAGGITIGPERELILAGAGNFGLTAPLSNHGGGASGLTHAGGGTVTLTGVNAYTGQTTVNSGRMVVSGAGSINPSSGIRVNGGTFVQNSPAAAVTPVVTVSGGSVDGTGLINTVNVADLAAARITNGNAATAALTIGNLTFGGDATIDIRTAGSAGLVVSGTLTTTPANGTITVNVTSAPVWTIGATYHLISYGNLGGTLASFTKGTIAGLGGRQTSTLVTSGNNIALTIGGDRALWTGAASGDWTAGTVASPFNWKTQQGGAATDFLPADDVVFDDTATTTTVNIADPTVNPTTTTFNNSTKSYTLAGGGITTGNLTKNGTNVLNLTNGNTYPGTTNINGGTLQAGSGNAIADAGLVALGNNPGATFQVVLSEIIGSLSGGGTTGGAVSLDALQTLTLSSGTWTFAGAITGAGTLTVAGARQTLTGVVSHEGGINVTSGVLTLGNSANSYPGNAVVASAAGLLVTANGALGAPGAGNETTVTGPASGTGGSLGLSGGITFSTAEKIIGSGNGSVANLGAGVFIATQRGFIQSVSGHNTFTGDIELSANGISRIGTQDGAQLTLTGPITQAAGVTTANILFRAGSTAGDFVTLSHAGNSFGGNSQIFTGATAGYAGVRLGVPNALPVDLSISGFFGSATGTALDLAGFDQSLNGLVTGGAGALNIINLKPGTPSTLTLNPTSDQTTTNTLILGGGGLGMIHLIKDGPFTQTLAGANTYSGHTTVTAGTLTLTNAPDPLNANPGNDASTVTLADTGATLNLTYPGTDIVDKLFIGGTQQAAGVYGPSATALPQITGNGTLTVLTGPGATGFSTWITGSFANGPVPAGQQGPNADPDNDGVPNLMEYAIAGQDPTVANASIGTLNGPSLTYLKRPGTTGLIYAIQGSTDLGTPTAWTEVTGGGYVNNATTISFLLTPPTPGRNFLRLQVVPVP